VTSDVRERRSGPKKSQRGKKQQDQKPQKLRQGMRVLVADLRVGDKLVKSWTSVSKQAQKQNRQLSDDEVMNVLQNGEQRYVDRTEDVKEKEDCPSQWRTHIHINKRDCYDGRAYVWIVKE
jgi:hypothetical protein